MTPDDYAVQRITAHTITFVTEHFLDQTGIIELTFNSSLTLPEVGETVNIIPIASSLTPTSGTVEPGNIVKIVGVFEGRTFE